MSNFAVLEGFYNILNGKRASTEQTRHGINPATAEANPEVPISTFQDVDEAVKAANKAFRAWSSTPYSERKRAVLALADGIEEHSSDFAKLLVQEQGKPMIMADAEVAGSVRWLRSLAKLELTDETIEESSSVKLVVRYTPLGVAVGIIPWNFPLQLACGKLAPAVLTGNSIILKPSPFTPYCGLKLAEVAQKFFPPGVVQALSGDDDLGPWLTAHPSVQKISFTGSTATGKKIMETAARDLKRVTLELGGKDPAIICKSVDIEAVATKVAHLGFVNSGQTCVAIKRVYVHESIYSEFRNALVAVTESLGVGEGTKEGVYIGPIQNSVQYEKVKSFFTELTPEELATTNREVCVDTPGYFIRPTIIDKPADDSRIAIEEQFGPILPLFTWTDEADVIARANNTRMGLGASVWSNNMEEAARIASQLEAGNVWVNSHAETDPSMPFGGHKESGIGCEWGLNGLKAFCNVQSMYIRAPTQL